MDIIHLINDLKSQDSSTRYHALCGLEGVKNPSIIEPIINVLNNVKNYDDIDRHGVSKIRHKAITVLEGFGDPRAIDALTEVLQDNDEFAHARCAAVKALGKIYHEQVITVLIDTLQNKLTWVLDEKESGGNDFFLATIADVLGQIGDAKAIEPLVKIFQTYFNGNTEITTSLKTNDEFTLGAVAIALARIGGTTSIHALIKIAQELLTREDDESLLNGVIILLGKIKSPLAIDVLITALKHKSWDVRYEAVTALGYINDPRGVIPIEEFLKDTAEKKAIKRARKVAKKVLIRLERTVWEQEHIQHEQRRKQLELRSKPLNFR